MPPILVKANVEICSDCDLPISRGRHIDHTAEAWQSPAALLNYLSLRDCTIAAPEQNYTFFFGLSRVSRSHTLGSPKCIDRTHASFFSQQT
jgi:hypothetical protein